MKVFGIICFSLLLAFILSNIALFTGNSFLFEFIKNQSIQIATTIIGFNIAVHAILVGQLNFLEEKFSKQNLFKETKKELKENALFSFIVLCLIFSLLTLSTTQSGPLATLVSQDALTKMNFIFETTIVASLIFLLFLLFDTIESVYTN